MARLALIGTVAAVAIAAGLVLVYVVYESDNDDNVPPAQQTTANSDLAAGNSPSGTTGTSQPGQTQTAAKPTQAPAAVMPSFDVVRVNPNGDTVVAGRAAPGAEVTLLDNGNVIGTATADGKGEWVLLPDSAMSPGQHSLTLRAQAGEAPAKESDHAVIILQPAPAKDIAGRPTQAPAGALAIEVPRSGTGPTRVLNMPGGKAKEDTLSLATVDYDQAGRAILAGTGKPKSTLNLYLDNGLLGQITVDDNGNWSYLPASPISPGLHHLRIDQVDPAGKVVSRVELPFEQAPTALAASNGKVVIQPGNSLWRLARQSYGSGLRYTVIYEANKTQIRNPDLIYPGQVFVMPKSEENGQGGDAMAPSGEGTN
ncbi:Ig-like domain-containing protein [Dongia soli]|uniref:Ig-like domain-containing protein n=1 Tax=Dongia soli TaxID=600628 RepID=A0ABU5E9G9_9PROT|nr:Ig-like domain-containing protein [Dongia soli]MDY0882694.1 Ig-like domain-containing protein [Dongia soli]